jgi:hypothetical protein
LTADQSLESLTRRLTALEAESAIRRVVAEYFRLCDTLGPGTPMQALGALFTNDAVWEGRGRYRQAFGRHEGRAVIVAMLARYADPPHFTLNAHYLSSESIAVQDAANATARWMMLQVSTYRNGQSDLRSAALEIDLRHEAGAWRISRFLTEAVFSRNTAPWNDEAEISVPSIPAEELI